MSDTHPMFTDPDNSNYKLIQKVLIQFLLQFLIGWAIILLITRDFALEDKNRISDILFLYIVIIILWSSFRSFTIFEGKEPTIASALTRGVLTPEKQIHSPPNFNQAAYTKNSNFIAALLVLFSYIAIFLIWF
ncbi:MAG: hypothetical protein GPJ54_07475 [Candidatus Heimdallarchaeota archaeon]|nr:hypothetical protein [Candidatus Heimdallarchaeota archaeon]